MPFDIVASWAANHQQFLIGAAAGWGLNHIPLLVGLAFHQAMRWPWLRGLIIKNPEQAKALIAEVAKELEADIDKESAPPKAP